MKDNKSVPFLGKYSFWAICMTLMFAVSCSKEKDDVEAAPDIALNKSSLILEKGKSERLIASFTPADTPNKGHKWNSSAPNVAEVDAGGMVSAVGIGESVITVTALSGNKMATCQVTVTAKIVNVTGISLNETETTLVAGDKLQLEATVLPENATDKSVKWNSGDNKVASVDVQGVVTGIAEGKTTITATTDDGEKSAFCKINVRGKGVEISKPEVSDVTAVSAFMTGTIQGFGVKVQESGICYSTSQTPTVDNQKVVLSGNDIAYTLTGLEPDITYYVRIYAMVDGTAKYGDQAMFTTEVPAEISEPKISSITANAAYIEGTIKTFGLQTDEIGICYSTSPMPTMAGTKVVLSNNSIAYTLNELISETTYYVRIYAIVRGEVHYGEQGVFATAGAIKTHFVPMDIYEDKITLISPGIAGVTTLKICYGTHANPKITDDVTTATKGSDGKLHLTLMNLKKGTTYYIRAYSLNSSKVDYYDDEVSAQTVGGVDFNVTIGNYKHDEYTNDFSLTRYRIYLTFTYNIKVKGTYNISIYSGYGYIKKNAEYTNSLYVENGVGTFSFMKDNGVQGYEGSHGVINFQTNADISFSNIESDIRYHYLVRAEGWDNCNWHN